MADHKAVMRGAPFIPTPHEVVDEMLRVAEVGPGDLLYDLGCGDGRIIIAAAQRYGARGVGVDINPRRIQESRYNARRAGIDDRAEFLVCDLFGLDIGKATVVTLYLLSSVNMRLRQKLFTELRPGARIVSHEFHLGDWPPDHAVEAEGQPVFCWVVPARAAGAWEWAMPDSRGRNKRYAMHISQHFQEVTATLIACGREMPLPRTVLKGDMLQFTAPDIHAGSGVPMRFAGRVDGDVIRGFIMPEGGTFEGVAWTARRAF